MDDDDSKNFILFALLSIQRGVNRYQFWDGMGLVASACSSARSRIEE